VDELPRAAKRLVSGSQARLRLASGSRLANSLMIPAIGRFVKRNPDVEIDFHLAQVQEVERIISDRFDVAVGTLLPVTLPAVVASPLIELPTVAVMRRDHVLARRAFVRAADVVAHKLIATPMGPMRNDLDHMFHSEGLELHPQYTANCMDQGCHMLLEVDAIMITDPLAPLAIDPKLFALVPLKPLRMLQTNIFTPVLKAESRLVAEFKACLREEAQSIEKRVAVLLGAAVKKTKPLRSSAT
jgi:DNA-binding transcriptional LysR family regulator